MFGANVVIYTIQSQILLGYCREILRVVPLAVAVSIVVNICLEDHSNRYSERTKPFVFLQHTKRNHPTQSQILTVYCRETLVVISLTIAGKVAGDIY